MSPVTRVQLKKYRDVIDMWIRKFDTMSIAGQLDLPEHLVVRWTANFQNLKHEVAA